MSSGLVADIGGQLGGGLQIYDQMQQTQMARQKLAQQQAKQEQLGGLLGGLVQDQSTESVSTDPQAMAQLAVQFPDEFEKINRNLGFIDENRKNEAADFSYTLRNTPFEQRQQLIQSRAESLASQGRDPSDTLELLQLPEQEQNQLLDVVQIAALSPEKRLKLAEGGKVSHPSSVRETEWFMNQTPEVQEKHLKLKRKTDPTMAEKLDQKQKESDIKIQEEKTKTSVKGIASRQQGFIDSGVEAADSLGNIQRVSDLLGTVETGGFDNAALRAKQLFGIESADEAELSAGLGKAILSQLKPIFGAAFTAQEGERLERIEANFGKSTEGNKRLISEVKRITERAARRGLRAAESQGDKFTASEIKNAIDAISKADSGIQVDPQKMSDEDLLKSLGIQ